ncbi:MAG: hypothetical protein QM658_15900 [Gordonia sp. (in: high G+C Gram-positive bacteria)]
MHLARHANQFVGAVLGLCAERGAASLVIAGEFAARPPGRGASLVETAGSRERAVADPLRWAQEAAYRQAAQWTPSAFIRA